MCIIIAKKKGKTFDREELSKAVKVAQVHNSHGGGFALKRAGSEEIYLSKGYISYYEIMLERLDDLDIQDDDELIIHLRYATSGLINQENCHPFVVSENLSEVQETEIMTNKMVMAHNGTLSDWNYINDTNSDTVNFILEFASQYNAVNALLALRNIDNRLASKIIGENRLAFLRPKADMALLGNWFTMEEGKNDTFVYSNLYCRFEDSYRAYGGHNPHKTVVYHRS